MKIKLEELVDMFDEIHDYEYIVYDKKENNFIFIDLDMMSVDEYEQTNDKIEQDAEGRYFYLPSSYQFHDSELIEEYIASIKKESIQRELEDAFYGKGKYRRFKDTLIKYKIESDYYQFRYEYLENMAMDWCIENNIEFEK